MEPRLYYFRVKQAIFPAPQSFISHHTLLVKWRCGEQGGRLQPVPLKGISEGHSSGRTPMVSADFADTSKVTVETDVLTVTLTLILIRHADSRQGQERGRETIAAHLPFSLGGVGTRLGVPQNGMITLGRYGHVAFEYSSVGVESGGSYLQVSPAGVGVEGAHALKPGGLDPVALPDKVDVFAAAEACLSQCITSIPSIGTVPGLATIANEGTFKSLVFEAAPDEAASILLFPTLERSIWEAFHILRDDELNGPQPWKLSPDRRCTVNISRPSIKLGNSGKRIPATECCFVCRIEDEYIARTIVFSNDAPVVGGGVKLDLVFHIAPDGEGGCVVGTFIHVTASDMARRLAGNMIAKYVEKIMRKAQEALTGLLTPRRLQGRDRGRMSYRTMRFRKSLSGMPALASSLDPCLWRRLVATDTLPNRELVYQYLSRLLTIRVVRVAETQVSALESVIVYHRECVQIVSACCNLLLLLCKASSFTVVHRFSSTLWPTLESVFALHPPHTFAKYADLVANFSRQERMRIQNREDTITRDRNVWEALEGVLGEVELVRHCLTIAGRVRSVQLTLSQVQLLTKAVTLHIQDPVVVRCALEMVTMAQGTAHLLPEATIKALIVGAQTHRMEEQFGDLIHQLDKRAHSLTHFERQFGTLNEKFLFHCKAWMTGPRLASIHLYLTDNYLIVGAFVLPIDSIHKVVQYRSLTLREGIRVVMSANHDDYFVVLSKRHELLTSLDKRRVLIEPPLEGY